MGSLLFTEYMSNGKAIPVKRHLWNFLNLPIFWHMAFELNSMYSLGQVKAILIEVSPA